MRAPRSVIKVTSRDYRTHALEKILESSAWRERALTSHFHFDLYTVPVQRACNPCTGCGE